MGSFQRRRVSHTAQLKVQALRNAHLGGRQALCRQISQSARILTGLRRRDPLAAAHPSRLAAGRYLEKRLWFCPQTYTTPHYYAVAGVRGGSGALANILPHTPLAPSFFWPTTYSYLFQLDSLSEIDSVRIQYGGLWNQTSGSSFVLVAYCY